MTTSSVTALPAGEAPEVFGPQLPLVGGFVPVGVGKRGGLLMYQEDEPDPSAGVAGGLEPGPERVVAKASTRTKITAKLDDQGRVKSVTETVSHQFQGVQPSGVRFTFWRTKAIRAVIAHASGKWTQFNREWKQDGRVVQVGTPVYGTRSRANRVFDPATLLWQWAHRLMGEPATFASLYPLAGHYGLGEDTYAPFLRRLTGATDAGQLARALFGKTRYRKDLVKAVARTDGPRLFVAWSMRSLVPVDWLVSMMSNEDSRPGFHPGEVIPMAALRPHLRGLDRSSLRRLLRTLQGGEWRMIIDLSRMPVAPLRRAASWTELHDATARHHRIRLRGEGMREVRASLSDVQRKEIADQRRHLSGMTPAGREVVVAEEPVTLLEWGERMGSCIASYDRKLVTGRAHLLGVYEGEKLIANAEVRTGDEALRLVQLRGRFNRDLPGPAERDVVGFLSDAGVDCLRRYAW